MAVERASSGQVKAHRTTVQSAELYWRWTLWSAPAPVQASESGASQLLLPKLSPMPPTLALPWPWASCHLLCSGTPTFPQWLWPFWSFTSPSQSLWTPFRSFLLLLVNCVYNWTPLSSLLSTGLSQCISDQKSLTMGPPFKGRLQKYFLSIYQEIHWLWGTPKDRKVEDREYRHHGAEEGNGVCSRTRDPSAYGCNNIFQWQSHKKKNVCVKLQRAEVNGCFHLVPIPQDESLPKLPVLWVWLFIWHEPQACFHCCNTIPKHTGLPCFWATTSSYYEFCISFGHIFIAFVLLCTTHSGKLWK